MKTELFNRAGDVVGTEQTTEREAKESRLTEQELLRVYQGRAKGDNSPALTDYIPCVPSHNCECNAGLTRRNYSRKPCAKCGTLPVRATEQREKPAERGNKNRVTCPALFTYGESEKDGFSRTIALRYLTKKIVYGQGRGKGKASDSVKTQNGEKASSSQHSPKWCAAHEIEDICQEAFIIYWEQRATGKLHNDTFRDTTRACRTALTLALRARQRANVDTIHYEARQAMVKERSKENATLKDLPCLAQELVNAAREATEQRGTTGKLLIQDSLANHFGITTRALRKRIVKARAQLATV